MTETDLAKIQQLLADYKLDGWLFTDFHGHDFITNDFLGLSGRFCTRRLFYYIPAHGEPVKLLSAIEPLLDRKSTRLNSSHLKLSRMPSSA